MLVGLLQVLTFVVYVGATLLLSVLGVMFLLLHFEVAFIFDEILPLFPAVSRAMFSVALALQQKNAYRGRRKREGDEDIRSQKGEAREVKIHHHSAPSMSTTIPWVYSHPSCTFS